MCLGWDSWPVHSSSSCCCQSPAADEWWPPLSDQASAVCLPLNDRNVECVCTQGRINFFHSGSVCFLLSYLENHCNLISFEKEDLVPPPITIWILIHPFQTSVEFFALTSVPAVCHSSTFLLCVCPSSPFVCDCWLWVIVCAGRVFISRRGAGGDRHRLGGCCENVIVWLCSALWRSLYSGDDFFAPPPTPQRGLLLCLPGIRNGK